MKILLAVDGSRSSDDAIAEVAARPWPPDSEVLVVTAYSLHPPVGTEGWAVPSDYLDEIYQALRASAEGVLSEARDALAGATALRISSKAVVGSPARVIVDKAAAWGADLVVLGSHGYGAVKRFLLGSVSHSVALHAPCSVEVVRSPASA